METKSWVSLVFHSHISFLESPPPGSETLPALGFPPTSLSVACLLCCLCILPSALTLYVQPFIIHFITSFLHSTLRALPHLHGFHTDLSSRMAFQVHLYHHLPLQFQPHVPNCLLALLVGSPGTVYARNVRQEMRELVSSLPLMHFIGGLRCSFQRGLWEQRIPN